MKRRTLIKTSAIITGYTFLMGGMSTISSCKTDTSDGWMPSFLTEDEVDLVAEISERILPASDTPGAKDAMVHRFIDENVKNNLAPAKQVQFKEALTIFDQKARDTYKKPFVKLSEENMDNILAEMVVDAGAVKDKKNPHIFKVIRDMTLFGFFSSEKGAKEFRKYDAIPGAYKGCIDYSEVGGVWSE